MSTGYEFGSIVWVRLSQRFWPGRVTSIEECPLQYVKDLKKEPLAIVKFFYENGLHDVSKHEHIFPYNCSRKLDFIRKGHNAAKSNDELCKKFEKDVMMAEKLTGGNMDIMEQFKEGNKRRIDYSDLGFGVSKVRKSSKDENMQRAGFSDIGEAIQYKRGALPLISQNVIIEHQIKILEQPKQKVGEEEMRSASSWFKCYICGFTCGRLNVIIWHNKAHLKKVDDFDTGITIPGKRKRKQYTPKSSRKRKVLKDVKVEVSQTNGHSSPTRNSQETNQLLLDWEDEEEDGNETTQVPEQPTTNGIDVDHDEDEMAENCDSDRDDEYDDNYPPPLPRKERQPMPKQVDINSAFDALLAESSLNSSSASNHNSEFVNNDSDSECSDWEKYYDKDSDSDLSGNKEGSDIKSLSEIGGDQNGDGLQGDQNGDGSQALDPNSLDVESNLSEISTSNKSGIEFLHENRSSLTTTPSTSIVYSSTSHTKDEVLKKHVNKEMEHFRSPSEDTSADKACQSSPAQAALKSYTEDEVSPLHPDSVSKSPSPVANRSCEEPTEEHSTNSSSSNSSTSSGPAYMLVAVDAHGNNVPMPVLSEGGNHLVAVEASMEDGTTRTLYIDPAHLGPNVDLNNLMLHIDNSGQETVIIPTSTSDGEIISSTLIEQPSQDSNSNSSIEEDFISSRGLEDDEERQGNDHLQKDNSHPQEEDDSLSKEKDITALASKSKNPFEIKVNKFKKSKSGKVKQMGQSNRRQKAVESRSSGAAISPKKGKSYLGKKEMQADAVAELMESTFDACVEESVKCISESPISPDPPGDVKSPLQRDVLEDDDGDDELPDLMTPDLKHQKYSADQIVWVKTNGIFWPSLVLKMHPKEGKAFVLFINCEQKSAIKVRFSRLKPFICTDYPDIYLSQKDKTPGITEAMEMASQYNSLKESDLLQEIARKFFSRPIVEQRSIINRLNLLKRGVPIEYDVTETGSSTSTNSEPSTLSASLQESRSSTPEVSEDCLSARERLKLVSATKARRTANERYINFIKSKECINYLRQICKGQIKSERHKDFKDMHHLPQFWIDVTARHNPGLDFFGQDDTEQTEEVTSFLLSLFDKEELDFPLETHQRSMYINIVLFPEAIKESLRAISKLTEEELEEALLTGLSQTPTEKKARRLEYDLDD